ncbi:MAG TPA: hypothetical protein VFN55_05310 [Solirubrobacteraceae bacterium]|nr:hypothetical protein [Solirubrobacteraceae bacterium]
MTDILDIRGAGVPAAGSPVLADPSGRRRRALTRAGRAVAVVFLLWLLGLTLAGLGVLPANDVPLAGRLVTPTPAPLAAMPTPRPPSASDLAPARSRQALATSSGVGNGLAAARNSTGTTLRTGRAGGRSGVPRRPRPATLRNPAAGSPPRGGVTAPGQTVASGAPGHSPTTTPASSGTAPGHAKTTVTTAPGRSGTAHQRTTATTTAGKSAAAPGQVTTTTTTTTTTPGRSGVSPGHTVPPGNGRGSGA